MIYLFINKNYELIATDDNNDVCSLKMMKFEGGKVVVISFYKKTKCLRLQFKRKKDSDTS